MPKRLATPRLRAGRPSRTGALVAVAVVAAVGVVWAIIALGSSGDASTVEPVVATEAQPSAMMASADSSQAATVEIPALLGMPVDEARVLLSAAGLVVKLSVEGEPVSAGTLQLVERQSPQQGALVTQGSAVTLVVRPTSSDISDEPTSGPRFVVCIDPGHQSFADDSPEPIGPKSKKTKPKISAGVTGVRTGLAEYEVALQIGMNLKRQLEERGVRVVMTRTTNDVNLSNAERAVVANKAKADLMVRIHGAGSPDADAAGVATVYPASNGWTKPVAGSSKRAALAVHKAVVAATAAPDRGTKAYGDQAGFNWSRVPAVLVECGFLSNPVEDRLLASPHYQDRVAQGIADGVLTYLEAEESR